ncbi:transposase [Cytophagaceae bacterium NT2B1]|nr:transposase [Xanthocytophaga flavus]
MFVESEHITLAACMAHTRRKFDEAASYDPARAKYAVAQIAKLYALEQQIHDATAMDATAMDATAMDATAMDATAMDATAMDATAMDATAMDATAMQEQAICQLRL